MTLETGTFYPSVTRKYRTPEGACYITIARSADDIWIDCMVGKAGTATNADAEAIAALAGIALRYGAPPVKVALGLKGISHEASNRLTFDALSVADAIGDALWTELC